MNRRCLNAKLLPIFLLSKVKIMPWTKKSVQSFSPSVVCLPCSCACFLQSCEAEGSQPLEFSGSIFALQRGSQESGWLSALLPLEHEMWMEERRQLMAGVFLSPGQLGSSICSIQAPEISNPVRIQQVTGHRQAAEHR